MEHLPELLTIGEAARRVGLRSSALRYYEAVGLLPATLRKSGQRRYDAAVAMRQIRFIQAAQKAGFSIEEIKLLCNSQQTATPYAEQLRLLARKKLPEVEKLIADAQAMKRALEAGLECRCETPEDCLLFLHV